MNVRGQSYKWLLIFILQHKKVGSQHLATYIGDELCYNI